MNVALRRPWTQQEFFRWAEAQEERFEFDGVQPVAMTGGTTNHSLVQGDINFALRRRLEGGTCQPMGPDAGIVTVGNAVRYPDALVTCSPLVGDARTVPGVVVVFEVLSPSSGRMDRIVKVREYAAVPSILRYVIVEVTGIGLTVLSRSGAGEPWTTTVLAEGDMLAVPEIGIEIPVSEIYARIEFAAETSGG